ncbi:MAG: DinB family protein [Bacteroidetes bacterium]|nr:DinB family protein [Bacteroidota bacterium]
MKKLVFLLVICQVMFLTSIVSNAQNELTKIERKKAIDHLKSSQTDLLRTVKGLSEDQLNFKSSEESWSIAECMEHLAISETALFGLAQQSLQEEADPSKRSGLPFSDDQVLALITDRSQKVKTQAPFEPKGNFGSYQGSVDEFKTKRKSNIKYVKSTTDDLRNHYFEFPFGLVDSYQVVLFMSGHSVRHTKQIKEIMAQESFPKS